MTNAPPIEVVNPIYPSPVFIANMKAQERIVINQGGTWSGKTYSILQAIFLLTAATKYVNEEGDQEPIITTIVGQDVPNLTKGAITDFQNILPKILKGFPESTHHRFAHRYNSTKKTYYFDNGARLEFSSFKDWQDAKAGKRHFLFINEANGISFRIFEQLQMRTRIRTFLDYNPDAPFWAHDLKGKRNVKFIYSNLTHNKFIPDDVKTELIAKGKINEQFKQVYLLGKTGKIEGLVFPNVNWVYSMPKHYTKEAYGMDFGFTNSFTTLVRVVLSEGQLYAQGLMYKTGLEGKDIVEALESLGISKEQRIRCDNNYPMTVKQMKRLGYKYFKEANKGKGSVNSGITLIKSYVLNIVDNVDWKAEQLGYKYSEEKNTGETENNPIKENDHYWDALRYAMQDISSSKRAKFRVRN